MKTMWTFLVLAAWLWLGCKKQQVEVAEPLQKKPFPNGGYSAFQLAGRNWPSENYTYGMTVLFKPLNPTFDTQLALSSVVNTGPFTRIDFITFGIPLQVAKTVYPNHKLAEKSLGTSKPMPYASFSTHHEDEGLASYHLDPAKQSTFEVHEINVEKSYAKGYIRLFFTYTGSDQRWEEIKKIDKEAKYRSFVLEGEFEFGKP